MNNQITIEGITYQQVKAYPDYYISKNSLIVKKYKNGVIKPIKKSQNSINNPMTNYEVVSFYVDNISTPKGKKIGVHQIMAETFLPKTIGKDVVNHIDGNKQNNNISNLEWCTQQENIVHAWANNLSSSEHCELEIHQYSLNGVYLNSYKSIAEATRITSIPSQNISKCANKLRPTAGGYIWAFEKLLQLTKFSNTRKKYLYVISKENFTKTFKSVTEVCTELNLHSFGHKFRNSNSDTISHDGYKIVRKEI